MSMEPYHTQPAHDNTCTYLFSGERTVAIFHGEDHAENAAHVCMLLTEELDTVIVPAPGARGAEGAEGGQA